MAISLNHYSQCIDSNSPSSSSRSRLLCRFPSERQAEAKLTKPSATNSYPASAAHFKYIFENPRFTTPFQEVEFDGDGRGQFRFQRKDQDEIANRLQVSPAVLAQIQTLLSELNFLASTEDYQHKKDFSHLGTMTISHGRGGQERTVKFNYTDNSAMNRLADIFRNLTNQETRIFEMETVLANDPISMPAQLRVLENELKSKHIADPDRFTPLLTSLKTDEAIPLIARNHAERLLQMIKKGK